MTSSLNEPARLRVIVVLPAAPPGVSPETVQAGPAQRRAALRIGLLEAGHELVASLPGDVSLAARVAQLQPDLIIIDSGADARDILAHVETATRDQPRPIVLFTEDEARASVEAAVAAGVAAYIVETLQPERLGVVLEVALARFRHEQKLLAELSDARQKLAKRKIVDRAKGFLMTRHQLTEEEAYRRLRTLAMNRNMKLADIARRVLDVEDLLG